ncbi:MAG: J domain-containing protein [Nanoarchaeota archaeon]|nr:J domain-containing protein [Nanoarchaeota archaeon]
MQTYTVKGHEIALKVTKTGCNRKATQLVNSIVTSLKQIGVVRDDIEVVIPPLANRIEPAVLEFWLNRYYCRFSYSRANRFIDNLYLISKLIEIEVEEVISGKKDIQEFYSMFNESKSDMKKLDKSINEAKVLLGVSESEKDVEVINLAYKKLARKHHPDLGGDIEEFQRINQAHKLILKEMGY